MSGGLDGHDVFSLGQAPDGSILAGTEHGIYRLKDAVWQRVGDDTKIAAEGKTAPAEGKTAVVAGKTRRESGRRGSGRRGAAAPARGAEEAVRGERLWLCDDGRDTVCGDLAGVLRSVSSGTSWVQVASVPMDEWRFVAASKGVVAVASLNALEMSADGGRTWRAAAVPAGDATVGAGGGRRRGAVGGRPGRGVLFGEPGSELADGEGNVPARRQQHLLR